MQQEEEQKNTQATPVPLPYPSKITLKPPLPEWRLLRHMLEVSARMTDGTPCHGFWGTDYYDLSSLIATIRTQINNLVGAARYIETLMLTLLLLTPAYQL